MKPLQALEAIKKALNEGIGGNMIITIHTDEATITLDNHSMMADYGMIALGEIREGICLDGEVTKERAREIIEEYVKEFLK